MHQLNRAMSKIISVEDDLVSNDELNPEAQIEKNEVETTIVRPQFSVDIKKHWNKRWKFVSCCLGVQCVIFLIVICVLATQYVNVKRKIRIMSKRTCKDSCKSKTFFYVCNKNLWSTPLKKEVECIADIYLIFFSNIWR